MPELPEVETTRRGIAAHCIGRRIESVIVREPRLRWPVSAEIPRLLPGQTITAITRRGKYLLLKSESGTVIIHLGMSGSLRVIARESLPGKHDHVDIVFDTGSCLRLRDPRRFGAVLWGGDEPLAHPLLISLGPEPLDDAFDGRYLWQRARGRSLAVKEFLMNSRILVGVGNIYANEALFEAGISPLRAAGKISCGRYERLSDCIKSVLRRAIEQGGTSLRDFVREDGAPGYFQQSLQVYGRRGEFCRRCQTPIRERRQGQRATFYCPSCQH